MLNIIFEALLFLVGSWTAVKHEGWFRFIVVFLLCVVVKILAEIRDTLQQKNKDIKE